MKNSLVYAMLLWCCTSTFGAESKWLRVLLDHDSPRFEKTYYAWGRDTLFEVDVRPNNNALELRTEAFISRVGNTYVMHAWGLGTKGDFSITVNASGEIRTSAGREFVLSRDTVWEANRPIVYFSRRIVEGRSYHDITILDCESVGPTATRYTVTPADDIDRQDLTRGNLLPLLAAIGYKRLSGH